jgi:hypothetical protein
MTDITNVYKLQNIFGNYICLLSFLSVLTVRDVKAHYCAYVCIHSTKCALVAVVESPTPCTADRKIPLPSPRPGD